MSPLMVGLILTAWSVGPIHERPTLAAARSDDGERLILSAPRHHLDRVAREPMLVEHPSGALFVAGYGSQVTGVDPRAVPQLWKSLDGGASWRRVDVGAPEEGAIGNSDIDLAMGPDGALYFASMGFNRTTFEGTHIAIGVSHDVGASWRWSLLSQDRFDDRPWVGITPDGTAHVIWNDGTGVSHAVSTDGGRTWTERDRIHPKGGSSHLAVGPRGELAVRIGSIAASGHRHDEGLEWIAISVDNGDSWSLRPPPEALVWDPTLRDPNKVPRWVEPLAWDSQGALYTLWSTGVEVRLARSRDRGQTWELWQVAQEERMAYFPFLAARGSGELAATWFTGRGDDMAVNVALIQVPEIAGGELRLRRSPQFQQDCWREGREPRVRDPGGEYVPVAFLSTGGLGVVTTIQDSRDDRFGFTWWTVETN